MIKNTDRICFLGDSITDGVGTTKRYIEYIAERTGAKTYGFGVNGAQSTDLFSQLERLDKCVGENFDILFVLIGTNDFNSGVSLGEFFTEHIEEVPVNSNEKGEFTYYVSRKKREFVFDENTFKGRLNKFFAFVKDKYYDKRIIIATPLHRAYAYFGGDNIQYDELYANSGGVFFDEYVETVKKAANVWACPLIDLNALCGLYPRNDTHAALFFANESTDRLHPSAGGHKRMAQAIAHALRAVSPYDHE